MGKTHPPKFWVPPTDPKSEMGTHRYPWVGFFSPYQLSDVNPIVSSGFLHVGEILAGKTIAARKCALFVNLLGLTSKNARWWCSVGGGSIGTKSTTVHRREIKFLPTLCHPSGPLPCGHGLKQSNLDRVKLLSGGAPCALAGPLLEMTRFVWCWLSIFLHAIRVFRARATTCAVAANELHTPQARYCQ